jgi:hypothetical protein
MKAAATLVFDFGTHLRTHVSRRLAFAALAILTAAGPLLAPGRAAAEDPTSTLSLRSSNKFLDDSFAWAKSKALSYVRTGQRPDYLPCYFAAMSDSEFCVRDVAHHMEGAHLLGLDTENRSMMRLFATGANRRVDQDFYWPRWHYPYTGKVAEDRSCQWRTLPAPFDMAWRCYEQYLWTGDERWINDPELFAYYTNLHTKFMEHQNWDNSGVAAEDTQLASYFEFPDAAEQLIQAGDAIGCQYQALLAYSQILRRRGDTAAAKLYQQKAEYLRAYFETHWFDEATGRYIRGIDRFTGFCTNWGHENSYFMPMTLITDQGPHTAAYLDFIDKSITREPLNIEANTYLPEVFFKHGRNEIGWKYLQLVMKSRNPYPEVSFTCVGNTISGLMGVRPSAPDHAVRTLPRLPAEITWIEADHVAVGGNDLRIRHDGNRKTTLVNRRGPTLHWWAGLPGNFRQLRVDGALQDAAVTVLNGRTITQIEVRLEDGASATVEAVGESGPDLPPPPSPQLPVETAATPPASGTHYLSDMTWKYGSARFGRQVKLDVGQDGKPITINGIAYPKGISVPGVSAVRYDLRRQYARLLCDVGLEDSGQDKGAAEFLVYGGGKTSALRYRSGIIRADSGGGVRHVNLDVSDCDYIVLGVKQPPGGDASGGAAWAGARLRTKDVHSATQPPAAPQELRASGVAHNSVHLQWNSAKEGAVAAGYDIYCGTMQIGTAKTPDFVAAGLTPNTAYRFSVKAWDGDGNTSPASPPLDVSTPLPPDLVYLSDLKWRAAAATFGQVRRDQSIDGHPLQIGGTKYPRGIGTHAESTIEYDLAKLGRSYGRFRSEVGVDSEVGPSGSVVFQVLADGKKVYDSGLLTGGQPAKTIQLDIAGVKRLKLIVRDGGDGIASDHADWAGARLSRK